jgi:hypothetical protein
MDIKRAFQNGGSFYYSYLTATRKEGIENVGNMDIIIPTYDT